jgi:PKD repeat protein
MGMKMSGAAFGAVLALGLAAAPPPALADDPAGPPQTSDPVPPAPPPPDPGPSIDNPAPREGSTLSGNFGSWSSGTTVSGEWLRCASGPTDCVHTHTVDTTYQVTAADVGKVMVLRARGENALGGFREVDSPATAPVDAVPTADFSFSPAQPQAGQRVDFTSSSTDPEGQQLAYAWDLDGDGFDDGSEANVSSVFPAAGDYTVSLMVTDPAGGSSVASKTVKVASAPPPEEQPPPPQQPPPAQQPPPSYSPPSSPPAANGGTGALPAPVKTAPRRLAPFPVVAVSGRAFSWGARLSRFVVRGPKGALVTVRCHGRRCPYRRARRRLRDGRVSLRALRRPLRPGTVIEVYVTKPGTIGKYMRLRIRRRRAPLRRDACLMPGSHKPVRCAST